MNEFEEYEEKIEQYLQGKMSDDKEAAFMKELNTNETLRKQYEEELLVRALFSNDNTKSDLSNNKKNKVVELETQNKQVKRLPFLFRYKYAAALIIIAAGTIILIKYNSNPKQIITAKTSNNSNQILKNDSLENLKPALDKSDSTAQDLYKKYYKNYVAKNDPVELSKYYDYYKNKEYNKVIAADKKDYAIMGTDNRQNTLNTYMLLYKGLSFLENNNNINAIKTFDSVLNFAGKNQQVYLDAAWYSALTYLKENKTESAKPFLKNIIESNSSYKNKAQQIIEQLK